MRTKSWDGDGEGDRAWQDVQRRKEGMGFNPLPNHVGLLAAIRSLQLLQPLPTGNVLDPTSSSQAPSHGPCLPGPTAAFTPLQSRTRVRWGILTWRARAIPQPPLSLLQLIGAPLSSLPAIDFNSAPIFFFDLLSSRPCSQTEHKSANIPFIFPCHIPVCPSPTLGKAMTDTCLSPNADAQGQAPSPGHAHPGSGVGRDAVML